MLERRPVQLAIFAVLVIAVLGIGYWHVFAHNHHSPDVASASTSGANDIQVDTQGNANVVITYRADLSTDNSVFDLDLTSAQDDLTKYNYKSNLVLTDADINPLPYRSITARSVSKNDLKVQFISNKYQGVHFHFDVRNLGGIEDRVLHFYHSL